LSTLIQSFLWHAVMGTGKPPLTVNVPPSGYWLMGWNKVGRLAFG
jgi:hypothetical protein